MDKKPKLHLLLTNSFQERVSWVASTSAPATAHGRLPQVERFCKPLFIETKCPSQQEYCFTRQQGYCFYLTMFSPCQPWAVDPEANRQTSRLLVRESEGREEQGCHEEQTGELIGLKINVIIRLWSSKQYQIHLEKDWWKGCFTKKTFFRIRYFALLTFCPRANTNWC